MVRTQSIFLSCFLAVACILAPAATLHLKNGRTIWADSVRENGTRIEYEVGENTFAIPKSLVDHFDAGGTPPEYSTGGGGSKSTDIAAPSSELRIANDVYALVLHDGKVDTDALAKLEKESTPDNAAAGYFLAGRHEIEQGNTTVERHFVPGVGLVREIIVVALGGDLLSRQEMVLQK